MWHHIKYFLLNQTFKINDELFDNFRVSWYDNIMGLSQKNEHF